MTPKTILVPIDFSTCAEHAPDYACGLADKLGSTIHLVNAIGAALPELGIGLTDSMIETLRTGAMAKLDQLTRRPFPTAKFGRSIVEFDDARDVILKAAEAVNTELRLSSPRLDLGPQRHATRDRAAPDRAPADGDRGWRGLHDLVRPRHLDGLAYWPGEPAEYFDDLGTTHERELARYTTVIHMQPPSLRHGYQSTALRIETPEEAAVLDERIMLAWTNHLGGSSSRALRTSSASSGARSSFCVPRSQAAADSRRTVARRLSCRTFTCAGPAPKRTERAVPARIDATPLSDSGHEYGTEHRSMRMTTLGDLITNVYALAMRARLSRWTSAGRASTRSIHPWGDHVAATVFALIGLWFALAAAADVSRRRGMARMIGRRGHGGSIEYLI